jgi:Fe-S-cluster-containing dehydrogenase component
MSERNDDNHSDTPEADHTNPLSVVINKVISRRDFLKVAGVGSVGAISILFPEFMHPVIVAAAGTTNPFPPNAKGMVIAEPTRCTGCRRCELACTEYNDGKAQPATARIKVARNLNYGPQGAQLGDWRGQGQWGNFRVIQDTCRQCPHPVPCQLACPVGAIEVVPPVNARVVNQDKCQGLRQCLIACPWGMTSFDEAIQKATKCHLCNGAPECVKACPTGALQYVPWQDKTRDIPQRWVVPASLTIPADVQSQCGQCHNPK